MKINEIIKEVDKVKGWFHPPQMKILYPIVKELAPSGLIVEVGTYHGRSTRFFSLANPRIKILTIDLVYYTGGVFHPPHPPEGIFIDKDVLKGGNIFQIVGESKEIAKGFNWEIDLLLIDGNHKYDSVKTDRESWSLFVKPGGYVVFHDYLASDHLGVTQAVDEWMKDNKEFTKITSENFLYIARKNEHV